MPPAPPTGLTVFFVAQVAGVAALLVLAAHHAGRASGESARRAWRWSLGTLLGVGVLLGGTAALAGSGVLAGFDSFPPPMMRLFAGVTALTLAVAWSPLGTRLAAGVPLAWLVGYQAFRIPVEVFLDRAYHAGLLPVQMTFEGWNFDILTGISALVVAVLAARGALPRAALVIWNVAGLALLATIVTIAVLSFPGPTRVFTAEPTNRLVGQAPFVWLPVFLVQAALLGHLLVFRWLRLNPPTRERKQTRSHPAEQ